MISTQEFTCLMIAHYGLDKPFYRASPAQQQDGASSAWLIAQLGLEIDKLVEGGQIAYARQRWPGFAGAESFHMVNAAMAADDFHDLLLRIAQRQAGRIPVALLAVWQQLADAAGTLPGDDYPCHAPTALNSLQNVSAARIFSFGPGPDPDNPYPNLQKIGGWPKMPDNPGFIPGLFLGVHRPNTP